MPFNVILGENSFFKFVDRLKKMFLTNSDNVCYFNQRFAYISTWLNFDV